MSSAAASPSPDAQDAPPVAVIVTTQPGLFAPAFARQSGLTVFVTDSAEDALQLAATPACTHFFADYRQLDDARWNGLRLARHLASRTEWRGRLRVYLMADAPTPLTDQCAQQSGAAALIKREPQAVARLLNRRITTQARVPSPCLDLIDRVFGEFTGPVGAVCAEETRGQLDAALIDATPEAYIAELAQHLPSEKARRQFSASALEAVRASQPEAKRPTAPTAGKVKATISRW